MSLAASSKLNYLKRQINKISRKDSEPVLKDDHTKEQLSLTMLSPNTNNSTHNAMLSNICMKNKMNNSALKKYSYQESNSKKPFKKKSKQAVKANSFAVESNNYHYKDFNGYLDDEVSDKNLNNATSVKGDKLNKDNVNANNKLINENAFLKKAPVNIFNIKNYNILKSENSKRDNSRKHEQSITETKKGGSVKNKNKNQNKSGSPKMDHKIHNFFVFIGNKESNGQRNKINNNSVSSYTPKRNTKKKLRTVDETVTDDKYIKLASIMKKDNSGYEGYQPEDRKIQIPNHIRQGLRRKEKTDSTMQKNETINFTEHGEMLSKQLAGLRREIDQSKQDSHITAALNNFNEEKLEISTCSTSQRNNPLLNMTKEKITQLFKTLSGVFTDYSDVQNDKKREVGCQTDDKKPKEIVFSNLNCMNLLKELAKEILLKGKNVKHNIENIPSYYQSLLPPECMYDSEQQTIIANILNYYQEQIIFEEALVILQEKGVDLENLFLYAYERLKINMEDNTNEKVQLDGEPSFTVVTDVTQPSSLNDVTEFDMDNAEGILENSMPKFELNLTNIRVEESTDNDDE